MEKEKKKKKKKKSHLAVDIFIKKLDIRLLSISDILKKKLRNSFCDLKKNLANFKCRELLRTWIKSHVR